MRPDLDSLRRQVESGITNASTNRQPERHQPPQTGGGSPFGILFAILAVVGLILWLSSGRPTQTQSANNAAQSAITQPKIVSPQKSSSAQDQARSSAPEPRVIENNPPPTPNPTATFVVRKSYPGDLAVAFFSRSSIERTWPGQGRHYLLSDSEPRTYALSCQVGETICYGAWTQGSKLGPFWGVGRTGRESCKNCCVSCPSSLSMPVLNLDAPASVLPQPTLAFSVRSAYFDTLAISFYSFDGSRAWPGNDQVYLLNDRDTHTYRLNCRANELICFGAWRYRSTSPSWGVGYKKSQGCPDCCYRCDGGETATIVLNQ
jgi:hypothetical protein